MQKPLLARRYLSVIALVLIIAGLILSVRYAAGSFRAYRSVRFAMQHDFHAGNLDTDLLRPWMPLRFIAVAYAVPQAFLFDELGVEMTKANSGLPLGKLNDRLGLGVSNDQPVLLHRVREAIVTYRANPVATGLAEGRVEPWMNIQYIANSTGIPAQHFFDQLGIPMDGNAYVPLDALVRKTEHGRESARLLVEIQAIIDTEAKP